MKGLKKRGFCDGFLARFIKAYMLGVWQWKDQVWNSHIADLRVDCDELN